MALIRLASDRANQHWSLMSVGI